MSCNTPNQPTQHMIDELNFRTARMNATMAEHSRSWPRYVMIFLVAATLSLAASVAFGGQQRGERPGAPFERSERFERPRPQPSVFLVDQWDPEGHVIRRDIRRPFKPSIRRAPFIRPSLSKGQLTIGDIEALWRAIHRAILDDGMPF